ncbi:MAG TPA: FAD/NAD(P)-binding protein [Candidatus Baltobacteraceae bacterium]|nr:FAD/NAD(P)-binding protein [Candidatus Baltobacteraceae bacterium]
MPEFTAIIAGGGASGLLTATRLVHKSASARVIIVEPRASIGRGMAYSTPCLAHVLNVPAGRMSAFDERPDHFVEFLRASHGDAYGAASYVPRRFYGDYLEAIAQASSDFAGVRWGVERSSVLAASVDSSGVRAICEEGRVLRGDVLIVATGNANPAPWTRANADVVAGDRFFASAWEEGALNCADREERVLLLGTGLTAVDAVIALRSNGHRGTIWMISRRGLLPHEHRIFDAPRDSKPEAVTTRDLLGAFRSVAGGRPHRWRAAVDGLRPRTNALWQALSVHEQRRFMRHVIPYWNAHRHRMAPDVAKAIAEEIAAGTLRMLAGRTGRFIATDRGLRVAITVRGSEQTLELEIGRAINCSGPAHDFRLLENPLIGNLLEQGIMHPLQSSIGIDVAPSGALRDASGAESTRVYAIGPVRFGTLIETTAMPEIRAQAKDLAALLAARADSLVTAMVQ